MSLPAHSPDFALLLEQSHWMEPLARRLLQDPERAQDLVQDTFAAAVQQPPAGGSHPGVLRAWLARVLRNRAHGEVRRSRNRRAREAAVAREERLPSASEALERTEVRRKLIDAVLELRPEYRDVVLLRFFESLETEEVARRLEITPGTVRTRLSRALGMLRERLDREYEGDRRAWALSIASAAGLRLAPPSKAAAAALVPAWLVPLVAAVLVAVLSIFAWRVRSGGPAEPGAIPEPPVTAALLPRDEAAIESGPLQAESTTEEAPRREDRVAVRPEHRIELRAEVLPGEDPAESERYSFRSNSVWLGPPHSFLLVAAGESQDQLGFPCVAVRLARPDALELAEWMESILDRRLAVMQDGEVIFLAVVESPLLDGRLQVRGEFSHERVAELLTRWGFPPPEFVPFEFHLRLEGGAGSALLTEYEVQAEPPEFEVRDAGGGFASVLAAKKGLESLLVKAPGYAEVRVSVSRSHPTRREALVLGLQRNARLQVTVVDSQERPVAGARVVAQKAERNTWLRQRWSPTELLLNPEYHYLDTDEEGRGSFEALPPGVWLEVELFPSWNTQGLVFLDHEEVELDPGETRSVKLTVSPRRDLRGRVLDEEGEAVAGATLLLRGSATDPPGYARSHPSVTADEAGRFHFEGVPVGEWWIGVAARAPKREYWSPVSVRAGPPAVEHEIRLPPEQAIRGRVVDGQGRPVPDVFVVGFPASGWGSAGEVTGKDGWFELSPVSPGEWKVWVGSRPPSGGSPGSDSSSWTGPAGTQDVLLVSETCSFHCRFDLESEVAPQEVEAMLYDAGGECIPARSTWTDMIEFNELTPGLHQLVLRSREGLIGVLEGLELEAGEVIERQAPPLEPGAVLELRVEGGRTWNYFVVRRAGVVVESRLVPPGGPYRALVPPGALVVELRDEQWALLDALQIVASPGRDARVLLNGR